MFYADDTTNAPTSPRLNTDITPSAASPYGGCWLYHEEMCPKSLSELVSSYHDSVGHNGYWLMDWAPNQQDVLKEDHLKRYAEFGSLFLNATPTRLSPQQT